MLLVMVPTLVLFVPLPSSAESFSEFWLLGPGHRAENYPFNIRVNDTYSVFVGVGNQLGYSAFYRVLVKFRNQTQPVPIASNSSPSPLPELYEFDFFVGRGKISEMLLNLRISNAAQSNGFMNLSSLLINDVPFRVNSISAWNETRKGFYYQLFLELWLYNNTSQSFTYHNRFVSLWLNMTT